MKSKPFHLAILNVFLACYSFVLRPYHGYSQNLDSSQNPQAKKSNATRNIAKDAQINENDDPKAIHHKFFNKKKSTGYSVLPLFAANSTYGFLYGAALAHVSPEKDQDSKTMMMAVSTTKQNKTVIIDHSWKDDHYEAGVFSSGTDFFTPYFGSIGRESFLSVPDQIQKEYIAIKPYAGIFTAKYTSLRLGVWYKSLKEAMVVYKPDGTSYHFRFHPDEITTMFYTSLAYDSRFDAGYSPIGTKMSISFYTMPHETFTILQNQQPFHQIEVDAARYLRMWNSFALATRISGIYSLSQPSYLFTPSLGGDKRMRGYGYQRFLGSHFYCLQEEVRLPINRIISSSIFLEWGDISNDYFSSPIFNFGYGIKLSLPPDYVAKLRLEVGYGSDLPNYSITADHAF